MIGIDTNVLVRYFVQDDAKQTAMATSFLKSQCTPDNPGWINRVVLCELVWVLERAYKASREEIASVLEMLAQTAEFQVEDITAVWIALRTYRDRHSDFSDTLIAVTNLANGCDTTITFDRKASSISGMKLLSG